MREFLNIKGDKILSYAPYKEDLPLLIEEAKGMIKGGLPWGQIMKRLKKYYGATEEELSYISEQLEVSKESVFMNVDPMMRNKSGEPFDLEPEDTLYPDGLVPVMKSSFEDAEQEVREVLDLEKPIQVCVDFDGTIAEYDEWEGKGIFGKLLPNVKEALDKLYNSGIEIIIYTCRGNDEIGDIVKYLEDNGVPYHYVNTNPRQLEGTSDVKLMADWYIDDKGISAAEGDWDGIVDTILNDGRKASKKKANKFKVPVGLLTLEDITDLRRMVGQFPEMFVDADEQKIVITIPTQLKGIVEEFLKERLGEDFEKIGNEEIDFEMENPSSGGHGGYWPTQNIDSDPTTKVKRKLRIEPPKEEGEENVEWIDKLSMKEALSKQSLLFPRYENWFNIDFDAYIEQKEYKHLLPLLTEAGSLLTEEQAERAIYKYINNAKDEYEIKDLMDTAFEVLDSLELHWEVLERRVDLKLQGDKDEVVAMLELEETDEGFYLTDDNYVITYSDLAHIIQDEYYEGYDLGDDKEFQRRLRDYIQEYNIPTLKQKEQKELEELGQEKLPY